MRKLSLGQARRIAIDAQGLANPRPVQAAESRIAATIQRLGLIQLDFTNVLVPAHYMVLFSRLGAYNRAAFHRLVYGQREFTEHWAHEASIIPMCCWPLLRYRRESHKVRPRGFTEFLTANPEYVARVMEAVREHGPIAAAEAPSPDGEPARLDQAWIGTKARGVLEAAFGRGEIAIADRRPNFARTFDLAERVVPAEHRCRMVGEAEAQRELLETAARAYGVATTEDLADYWRMPVATARPRIEELEESGVLERVEVAGWRETPYLYRGMRRLRAVKRWALLSPFDPLVWYRPRALRLFGFDYRIEIYVPPERRQWGYYVLPFLLGERIAARVDLKADRESRRLLVQAAHLEPESGEEETAAALAEELRLLTRWLGLEGISVRRDGDLSRRLAAALGPRLHG